MSASDSTKIAVIENEIKHIQDDVKEIKQNVETILSNQNKSTGIGDFLKSNYKLIIILFALFKGVDVTGGQLVDLVTGSHASAQQEAKEEIEDHGNK